MRQAAILFAAICSWPVAVRAAVSDIELGIVNNQIVTGYSSGALPSNDLLSGVANGSQNVRVVNVPLVKNNGSGTTFGIADSGWYGQMSSDVSVAFSGPGIAYGAIGNSASGFTPGNVIAEYVIGSLQIWNGSTFVLAQNDRLEGIAGALDDDSSLPFFTDATGAETGSCGIIPETITPDADLPVEWRLDAIGTETPDPSPADGIYLVELQAWTNQRVNGLPVAPSLPFYFVFDKNDDAQLNTADAYVQNFLVPEPTVFAGLGICLLLHRIAKSERSRLPWPRGWGSLD